jgi:hypothetical protein
MPTPLRDEQHELALPDGSMSIVFGTADTRYLTTTPMQIERSDPRTGDTDRMRESGTQLGEDYLGSKSVTFEMGALTDRDPNTGWAEDNPKAASSTALNQMARFWNLRQFRRPYAAYAVLRSNIGGKVTRCYGRPRRWAPTRGDMTKNGWTPILADFLVPDGCWYDDELQRVPAGLNAASEGGVAAPIVAPVATVAAATSNNRSFIIAGTEPTWVSVVFHAESSGLTNPEVTISQAGVPLFTVGLTETVPSNSTATVDPRPWVRAAYRDDGANVGLSYKTPPMGYMQLDPGVYSFALRGLDTSSSGWAEVLWRSAYDGP